MENEGVEDWLNKLSCQINQVLEGSGRKAVDGLRPDQRLRQDLQLDSLELAELTVRLEAEFGVDVFRDGIVETVEDVLQKLQQSQG